MTNGLLNNNNGPARRVKWPLCSHTTHLRKRALALAIGLLAAGAVTAQETAPPAPTSPGPTSPGANPNPTNPTNPTNPVAPVADPDAPSPYVFGISQAFRAEDNLFRAPEGGLVVRDGISSTGLRVGIDRPIGRQHFNAEAQANVNRYRNNKQLNNTDYRLAARLNWETVERVSGEISAEQRRSLFRDTIDGVISTERNQVRSSGLAFQIRVGLVTLWSFEGGVAASENIYTGAAVESRDQRQRAVNAGLRWRPSDALSARVGLRRSEGSYPSFGTEPDDFTRDDLDLIGTLQASGASRLNARLSATREQHTVQSQRDSNGWTGALGWHWQPTGKLVLDLDLLRDSSIGRTGFDSSLIGAESSDARLSQSAVLALTWEATAKIRVVPRVSYLHRKLDGGFGAGGTLQASDSTTSAGLAVRYQPMPALELACDVTHEQRTTDGTAGLSAPYKANTASCSAQFALR